MQIRFHNLLFIFHVLQLFIFQVLSLQVMEIKKNVRFKILYSSSQYFFSSGWLFNDQFFKFNYVDKRYEQKWFVNYNSFEFKAFCSARVSHFLIPVFWKSWQRSKTRCLNDNFYLNFIFCGLRFYLKTSIHFFKRLLFWDNAKQ